MRQPTKACRPHQTSPTRRNPSTHRAAFQSHRCKLNQARTRILVSRWSATCLRLSKRFLSSNPARTLCSLRRRQPLASTSQSTCFARPAWKDVWSTSGSSICSGSRRALSLHSSSPCGPSHEDGISDPARTGDLCPWRRFSPNEIRRWSTPPFRLIPRPQGECLVRLAGSSGPSRYAQGNVRHSQVGSRTSRPPTRTR